MKKPKAIRAYSLDIDLIQQLERYCAKHDTWGNTKSRSKVVNDAIRWFLSGNLAEKLHSAEQLQENFNRVCIEKAQLEEQLADRNRFDLN